MSSKEYHARYYQEHRKLKREEARKAMGTVGAVRICKACGKSYKDSRKWSCYCSGDCKNNMINNKRGEMTEWGGGYSNTGGKGAGCELIVCVDLLRKGADVFRSVSASSDSDLVAVWGKGIPVKIQVTAGSITPEGGLGYGNHPNGNHDVLAVAVKGDVIYIDRDYKKIEMPTEKMAGV